MHINIAQRLRPFSHFSGTVCLLPDSFLGLHIYPTKIFVDRLNEALPVRVAEIHLDIKGPVNGFTVEQDLEKGCVRVWGHAESGYFRYSLTAQRDNPFGIIWKEEKKTSHPINPSIDSFSQTFRFSDDETLSIKPKQTERLSLGDHKAQNWEILSQRQNLRAIFPFWLRLGQLFSFNIKPHEEGTASLLQKGEFREPDRVLASFLSLLKVGFQGLFYPSLFDLSYQGIDYSSVLGKNEVSPLTILQQGASLIRRLFIEVETDEISVLPCLPSEFNCGRFLHLQCGSAGLLDMEWTKKQIRRMIFYSHCDQSLKFKFPKEIRSFRLRQEGMGKGAFFEPSTKLEMGKGVVYYFDNFQR